MEQRRPQELIDCQGGGEGGGEGGEGCGRGGGQGDGQGEAADVQNVADIFVFCLWFMGTCFQFCRVLCV